MGFSIGGFLGSIAPLVGSLFGPVGAALGTAVGAGLAPQAPSQGPRVAASVPAAQRFLSAGQLGAQRVTSRFSGVGLQGDRGRAEQVQLRVPFPRVGPGISGVGVATGVVSVISAILMRAREFTGRPVSARKIRDAAKFCGLDVAASMFGLSTEEVCQIIIAKRHRRRGISASDLRRTRSTIRKINTMRKSLKKLGAR